MEKTLSEQDSAYKTRSRKKNVTLSWFFWIISSLCKGTQNTRWEKFYFSKAFPKSLFIAFKNHLDTDSFSLLSLSFTVEQQNDLQGSQGSPSVFQAIGHLPSGVEWIVLGKISQNWRNTVCYPVLRRESTKSPASFHGLIKVLLLWFSNPLFSCPSVSFTLWNPVGFPANGSCSCWLTMESGLPGNNLPALAYGLLFRFKEILPEYGNLNRETADGRWSVPVRSGSFPSWAPDENPALDGTLTAAPWRHEQRTQLGCAQTPDLQTLWDNKCMLL